MSLTSNETDVNKRLCQYIVKLFFFLHYDVK